MRKRLFNRKKWKSIAKLPSSENFSDVFETATVYMLNTKFPKQTLMRFDYDWTASLYISSSDLRLHIHVSKISDDYKFCHFLMAPVVSNIIFS